MQVWLCQNKHLWFNIIWTPKILKDYHGASKKQMNPCPGWIQPWSKSWTIYPVPDPSKLKGKQPYVFSLHPMTLKEPNLNYADYVVAKLMQLTSLTWKIFLTPSKNPESTRIDNNKIPVSLTICKKQRMKKFCGNVHPFINKNTQSNAN